MVKHRNIKGHALIPVLLLASIIGLGIIILLQTQLIQKKSISDFKDYVTNKRQEEKEYAYLSSLSAETLMTSKNIKPIQKIPQNLHYQNNAYHYYFQINDSQYIYKLDSQHQNAWFSEQTFEYAGTILEIIQLKKEEGNVFFLYDKSLDKIVFQTSFKKMPVFQLVGNPINSIYFYDSQNLYKLEMNFIELAKIKILKSIENEESESDNLPILQIMRDAKGDGRLIYLSYNNQPPTLLFHEALSTQDDAQDLFEHY